MDETLKLFLILIGLASPVVLLAYLASDKRAVLKAEKERQRKRQVRLEYAASIKSSNPVKYFRIVLEDVIEFKIFKDYLEAGYTCTPKVDVAMQGDLIGMDCRLPAMNEINRVKSMTTLRNGEKRVKSYSDREFNKIYEEALYSLCLSIVHSAFELDQERNYKQVLFNGYVEGHNKATGQFGQPIIMSLLVSREKFEGIDLTHADSKECFRFLKGVSAAKLADVTPINPILILNKEDKRFVDNKEVTTHSGTNLAAMDWEDFEHLVRELFERAFSHNGGEVRVTQASRDGGVDAIIFDPDPIRGGKIVVQAKRYTNTVPVSAVRDLYGTVINEGANTGILITTSDYGHDSYEFAKDKPLKLLNSGHLLGLLQKNGVQGYIDIQEAKSSVLLIR